MCSGGEDIAPLVLQLLSKLNATTYETIHQHFSTIGLFFNGQYEFATGQSQPSTRNHKGSFYSACTR
jgi:hypothetical protein